MQADDDVGKVAQIVPVIISKALELFMDSVVKEASKHAHETGHKRVIPGHIKLAVQRNAMFDFLEPNIEKIPDPIQVEVKSKSEDKKQKKSRSRKTDENAVTTHESDDGEADLDSSSTKRIKLDQPDTSSPPPVRIQHSMSIASLMSPQDHFDHDPDDQHNVTGN